MVYQFVEKSSDGYVITFITRQTVQQVDHNAFNLKHEGGLVDMKRTPRAIVVVAALAVMVILGGCNLAGNEGRPYDTSILIDSAGISDTLIPNDSPYTQELIESSSTTSQGSVSADQANSTPNQGSNSTNLASSTSSQSGSPASQNAAQGEVIRLSIRSEYETGTPEGLYEFAHYIVIATYREDICMFANPQGIPQTISTFTILEVVKGDISGKVISVRYNGGRVTLEEYMKTQGPGALAKLGLDEVSEEYARNTYVEYDGWPCPVSFSSNTQRYMLFLRYDAVNETYMIVADGFSALKVNDDGLVYSYSSDTYVKLSFY